ncbi:TRAP transporter small permease subunit [Alloalcanivorax sp. C16-2]|uniref:TRAP transporter small permease subunit n=1 Tax=Alloalcanivorax sp. C16-2 TaxID=3390052 RepID=UPI003970A3C6
MNGRSKADALATAGEALMAISAKPGRYGAWILIALNLSVLVSVFGAQMGWSDLLRWEGDFPLLGNHLNMTSIAELQWHFFALLVMLSGVYAMRADQHIRVDVLSVGFSPRTRLVIDLIGDLFFLMPFFGLVAWYSMDFVAMAFQFGEQSNSGGLVDRYLVKAVVPLGAGLMLLCGLGRVLRNLGLLFAGRAREERV